MNTLKPEIVYWRCDLTIRHPCWFSEIGEDWKLGRVMSLQDRRLQVEGPWLHSQWGGLQEVAVGNTGEQGRKERRWVPERAQVSHMGREGEYQRRGSRTSRIRKGQDHDQNRREEAWWWYNSWSRSSSPSITYWPVLVEAWRRSRKPGWLGEIWWRLETRGRLAGGFTAPKDQGSSLGTREGLVEAVSGRLARKAGLVKARLPKPVNCFQFFFKVQPLICQSSKN